MMSDNQLRIQNVVDESVVMKCDEWDKREGQILNSLYQQYLMHQLIYNLESFEENMGKHNVIHN